MTFSTETLRNTILKGLRKAQSSEAERIREGLEFLYDRELTELTNAINRAIDPKCELIVFKNDEDEEEDV